MRRTLLILTGFLFVALLLTVGYALLGLGGPAAVLRQARHAMNSGELRRAIDLLNLAIRDLGEERTTLLGEALRMRASVYERLDLRTRMLGDLDRLIDEFGVKDRELECARIRVHNEVARERSDVSAIERSLALADRWLAAHQDDAYVLAQAGIAHDLRGELGLQAWRDELRPQIPTQELTAVLARLDKAVYTTAGERLAADHAAALAAALETHVPGISGTAAAAVQRIRQSVLTARGFYQRCLATRTPVLPAWHGMAQQLRLAGDDDALLMVAHNYLQKAGRRGLVAALQIAEIHIRRRRFAAAEEIAERSLPLGTWQERLADGTLDHDGLRLIFCRAYAARELGNAQVMARMSSEFQGLLAGGEAVLARLRAQPLLHLVWAMLLPERDQQRQHTVAYINAPESWTCEWNRDFLLDLAFRKFEEYADEREGFNVYGSWRRASPDDPYPLHRLAAHWIHVGQPEQALSLLRPALDDLPAKDRTLDLLVEAQQAISRLDLDAVIQNAVALQNPVPDELGTAPVLFVAAARRALQIGAVGIALACAEQAQLAFPQTRTPLYLEAEACLAAGRPQDAAAVARLLRERDPDDDRALDLLVRARRTAGEGIEDLRFALLLHGRPSLDSCRFLARRWLERREHERVANLAAQSGREFGPDLEIQALATQALMREPSADRREVLTWLRQVYQLSRASDGATPRERELSRWALGQYIVRNPQDTSPEVLDGMLDRFLDECDSAELLAELVDDLVAGGKTALAYRAARSLTSEARYHAGRCGEHLTTTGRLALRSGEAKRARDYFRAALAFADRQAAELQLAVLDWAEAGKAPALDPTPEVDSVLLACIVSDRAKAVPWLEAQLRANAHDLGAQCALALIEPDAEHVSAAVAALARTRRPELRLLVALLQDTAWAKLAVARADALVAAEPDSPIALLLQARAQANAGDPGGVYAALKRSGDALVKDTLLMAEALQILSTSDHPMVENPRILDHLIGILLRQGAATPPALMATIVRHNRELLDIPGVREKVLPLVSEFWLKQPELSGAGMHEARILVEAGNPVTALALLKMVEPRVEPDERGEFLELYFATAAELAPRADPVQLIDLVKEAIGILKTERVHGAPLHFVLGVLDDEVRRLAGSPAADQARQRMLAIEKEFLVQHVGAFRGGKDRSVANLARTLARLGERHGIESSLREVDELLHADPSLVPIWCLRASWLVQRNRTDEAMASLLWLPRYLEDRETLDTLIQVLARAGRLVEKGRDLLEPTGLLKASKLSLGLVQLRLGTYWPAAQAMALAEPQRDGAHLYFRAMAFVALQTPEADATAKSLLTDLAQRYPDSAYASPSRLVAAVL